MKKIMDKNMRKKCNAVGFVIFLGALLLLLGLAGVVLAFVWQLAKAGVWHFVCIIGGAVLSILGVAIVGVNCSKLNKLTLVDAYNPEEVVVDDEVVNYIPSQNVFDFVQMGGRQTVDEKFVQIAQMDKTQFVIYMARLFSLNGYQVRLTTVTNNRNIDMLVEKHNAIIAVGCIKANKVLSAEDVDVVRQGARFYTVHSSMVLTNTYFDRSALDYARAHGMSLVDRTILAEDFFQ